AGAASIGFLPLATGTAGGTLAFAADGAICGLPANASLTLSGNGIAAAKPDGGTTPDGGVKTDGGAPDGGSPSDSGAPVDSGIHTDASFVPDGSF
ncbi:MAG TPA: hypothetical protein VF407_03390, partial [Polyangiaceae bacterium]